jgi:glycosyltransferase involved in cell wall biosynthesis
MKPIVNQRGNLAIVIPALNEAETIGTVVTAVAEYGVAIVVDDGSTDGTGTIAADFGAIVVRHPINRGYDQSLAHGLQVAIEKDFEFAITLDADGQHKAELIDSLLESLLSGSDLVVGCRDIRQRFSEVVFAWLAKLAWKVDDPLCGIKGYKLSSLRKVQPLRTYDSVGTELAILASRSGWRIAQFPIITKPRIGVSRFGGGIKANWKILKALSNGVCRVRRVTLL